MSHIQPVIRTSLLCVIVLLVAVPAASATITSSPSGTKASLGNTGNVTYTVGSNVITCATKVITATISGSSMSATQAGTTWAGCTYTFAGISGAVTINDANTWTFTITASTGGGSFSVSMTNGTVIFTAGPCTITIAAKTYSGLTWTNTTKSLVANITGISYTASGFLCSLPASGSNMAFAGSFSEPTLTVS